MHDQPREHVPIPLPWRLRRELRLPRAPWWMITLLLLLVVLASVPIVWLLVTRGRPFSAPRVDWIQDMGVQPRFGAQAANPMFLDGRAMRLPVPGTVAQGSLQHDPHFYFGYQTLTNPETKQPEISFYADLPPPILQADLDVVRSRGQRRYDIYCLPCHGTTGSGDGLVSLRAKELAEPKWVPPTHLMTQAIRERPSGYLFSVISRGVRNMPSYAIQIAPEDRWAIVAYLRQLQSEQPIAPEPATSLVSPPATSSSVPPSPEKKQ